MTGQELRAKVMSIVRAEMGTKEVPGKEANPRILEYHKATTLGALSDEIAWCSAFVNWVLQQAGLEGTHSPMARSFLRWGVPIKEPFEGCVVILRRGPAPFGHVGFYVGRRDKRFIRVVGGNQGDQVKESVYDEANVLGYRWIEDV